jgi:hypothetical protein
VSFSSDNPAVAAISGNTVTIVGVGTANITASQAGNANYAAATSVVRAQVVSYPSLVQWDMSSLVGTSLAPPASFGGAGPIASSFAAANVTSIPLTRGSGVTVTTGGLTTGGGFGGYGWLTGTTYNT